MVAPKIKKQPKPKILIVEDERFLCELMAKKLEISGFDVERIFDGETALRAVEEQSPSVILLDLLLPGIDGFEFLRRLKADQRFKHIPVVVFSNLGEPSDIEKARNFGAAAYLVKANYSPDEVVATVSQFTS